MIPVSVVLPVYNNFEYLPECLDSLVGQSLRGLEIIVVNDGSTDERVAPLLAKYATANSSVKIITQANGGYGKAVNVGFDLAGGKYIGVMESDDFAHPLAYELLYKHAEAASVNAVKCDFAVFVDYKGERLYQKTRVCPPGTAYGKPLSPARDPGLFRAASFNQPGLYLAKFLRDGRVRLRESPGASFQDNGLFFQIMALAGEILYIDVPLYFLRRDNDSSSVNSREKADVIFAEYAFIEKITRTTPGLKTFFPAFLLKKFKSYHFNLRRVGQSHKKTFLERFAREFRAHESAGELDLSLFTEAEKNDLRELTKEPEAYLRSRGDELKPGEYLRGPKAARDAKLAGKDFVPQTAAQRQAAFERKFFVPPEKIPRSPGLFAVVRKFLEGI